MPQETTQSNRAPGEDTRFKTESTTPLGKVIEVIGHSRTSFQDAIESAVTAASETLDHISGIEVKSQTAKVRDGQVVEWQVAMKLAFGVERRRPA